MYRIIAGVVALLSFLGYIYWMNYRVTSLKEENSALSNKLEVMQESQRIITSQNSTLLSKVEKVKTETRIERTIINEVPVQPEEECVSEVLRKAVQ